MKNKVRVVLRDPLNKADTLDYIIRVNDTELGTLWYSALDRLLSTQPSLEKNFCFLGFYNTPRNLEYLSAELESARAEINSNFDLSEYHIPESFATDQLIHGTGANQILFNKLHTHFEHLQGTDGNLSELYQKSNISTKYAIRQLNILCHEAESLILSLRKHRQNSKWKRPSQITTFLNAPRYDFPEHLKQAFDLSAYDRKFGHVYLHWSQIGKTIYEVFADEKGIKLTDAACSAITHLKQFSGEFDIEWGRSSGMAAPSPWHVGIMLEFKRWLIKNNIDLGDTTYNYGYHEIGHVDLVGSFGTITPERIWNKLGTHLDIVRIETETNGATFDYSWADSNYKQLQMAQLTDGYHVTSNTLD